MASGEKKVAGIASLYLVNVKPGSKAYRYDVDIRMTSTNKSLAKGADDGQQYINKKVCLEVMKMVYNKKCFGTLEIAYAYDQRAILFTSIPISEIQNPIQISSKEVPPEIQELTEDSDFEVIITETSASHVVDLTDYSQYSLHKPTLQEDRSVRTCLEMIIKMDAIQRNEYASIGPTSLVQMTEKKPLGLGLCLKSGLSQGVRIVENFGNPTPAYVLDVKKSLFYEARSLISSYEEFARRFPREYPKHKLILSFEKLYKDIRVFINFSPSRSFEICDLTKNTVGEITIKYKGETLSLVDYFSQVHDIKIKHLDKPAVYREIGKDKYLVYPLEVLTVVENQRVPLEKMTSELSNEVLRMNTVKPHIRFEQIHKAMEKLRLLQNIEKNGFLEGFGISIDPDSHRNIEMRVLKRPDINMGGKKVNVDAKTTRWFTKNLSYTQGAVVKKWAILYQASDREIVLKFRLFLFETAKQKGVRLANPEPIKFSDDTNIEEWDRHFKFLANAKADFVLYIGTKKVANPAENSPNLHARLKLFESLYKVLTQHVATETIDACLNGKRNAQGQIILKDGKPIKDTTTVENILNKLNCKNAGINYKPIMESCAQKYALETGNVLVISYDVAHPTKAPMRERRKYTDKSLVSLVPSVVGYVGNVAKDPHSFVGDFFYHESRREAVNLNRLKEKTKHMLELLKENRPKHCKPEFVFIIRDGLSEGQFAMARYEELKEIKQGFYEYDPKYKPKFVMVIATKRHNKRFAKIDGENIVNADPGTVVEKKFTREDCREFFMLPHYPIQGTGKFTEFAVLFDEIGISDQIVKYFLLSLCYEHQIVSSAISIPAPVFQADELAKRGMNVYKEMKNCYSALKNLGLDLPPIPTQSDEYEKLTKRLSYQGSHLESQRFTA